MRPLGAFTFFRARLALSPPLPVALPQVERPGGVPQRRAREKVNGCSAVGIPFPDQPGAEYSTCSFHRLSSTGMIHAAKKA